MDNCDRYDCTGKDTNCFRCFDYSFYRPPKQKKFNSFGRQKKNDFDKNAENSWEGLEGEVTKSINKIPTYYEAERQIRSGGLWWAPGDVSDKIIFAECKERKGNEVVSKGTKSFTIDKNWLDKGVEEARLDGNKPFFLPWRFKGDDKIWVNTTWDWIAELVGIVKALRIEVDKKNTIINAYKKKVRELGGNDEDVV